MVGVLRHEHLGDRALGGKAPFDEMRWRRGLGDRLARTPGRRTWGRMVTSTPKLRRHDVEPLGALLTDCEPSPRTRTWHFVPVGLDDPARPGEGSRAGSQDCEPARATSPPPSATVMGATPRAIPRPRTHRPFEVFKRELALVVAELLRASTVQRPAKLAKQVFQTTVLLAEAARPAREAPQPSRPGPRWRLERSVARSSDPGCRVPTSMSI